MFVDSSTAIKCWINVGNLQYVGQQYIEYSRGVIETLRCGRNELVKPPHGRDKRTSTMFNSDVMDFFEEFLSLRKIDETVDAMSLF